MRTISTVWAMSKPLPTHGFKWMKVSELEIWENHSCILEVDLEYPKSLHDLVIIRWLPNESR